ncbi:MAG: hypothetical protein K6C08_00410 [Oscillospiraceae bacterium]|nr:hypothetical protein [Oscillospiraceae bacterium]
MIKRICVSCYILILTLMTVVGLMSEPAAQAYSCGNKEAVVPVSENGKKSVQAAPLTFRITDGTDTALLSHKIKSEKASQQSSSSSASSATAALLLEDGEEITGGTYSAAGEDQSVIEAQGDTDASVASSVIRKTGGGASSADGASFRGINAAVRVSGNAVLHLADCEIEADAANATGVFAYENGTVTLENCIVRVNGGGAGGVQVAGGGTLLGSNLTVSSASKAAIRSDRGGGTMILDGGSYVSTGSNGCPAIYSTADITVRNADCRSVSSRAVIIEGKNSVTLENCSLIGNDQSTKEGSIRANVLLYQSASGDAGVGTSVFTMKGGRICCQSGAMFYCTNTDSAVHLEESELVLSDSGDLLTVSSGRWGRDGSNGGHCIFDAVNQELAGNITVDSISSLSLNLSNSRYTGAVNTSGQAGSINVSLDEESVWKLTADSYLSGFSGPLSSVIGNGYHLYVNGECIL